MIRPVTVLNMTQNCHNHEKGKVFYAPKKTKPLPTGIGCHSLHTQGKKKINIASAQPAQGPSLKPSLQGRQCAFVFQSVGNWLGQEPEVRNVYGRKFRRVLSRAGWKLLAGGLRPRQRHPRAHRAVGTKGLLQRQRPGLLSSRLPGIRAAFLPHVPSSAMILLMVLGAFRIRFGTFQNWHGHVFSLGAPLSFQKLLCYVGIQGHSLPLTLLGFGRGGAGRWQMSQ